jgi:hypothetical protein
MDGDLPEPTAGITKDGRQSGGGEWVLAAASDCPTEVDHLFRIRFRQ